MKKGTFWGDRKVVDLTVCGADIAVCIVKRYWALYFRSVHFVIFKFTSV